MPDLLKVRYQQTIQTMYVEPASQAKHTHKMFIIQHIFMLLFCENSLNGSYIIQIRRKKLCKVLKSYSAEMQNC